MSAKFNTLVDAAEEMLPLLPWYVLTMSDGVVLITLGVGRLHTQTNAGMQTNL